MEHTLVTDTYESIYFSLWEMAKRYGHFTMFRVIGNSHDDRMIPMLEIGTEGEPVFCVAGFAGTDRYLPLYLTRMAEEYCRYYECGWSMSGFYEVQKLLSKMKLCVIPLANPDGYEICKKGYGTVRNTICRQMLQMQELPAKKHSGNGRNVDLRSNFPTVYSKRKQIHQEPASENETRALIHIFQEYHGRGLLSFQDSEKGTIGRAGERRYRDRRKSFRLARHLQKCSHYGPEKQNLRHIEGPSARKKTEGTPEQFYTQLTRQPSFLIRVPAARTSLQEQPEREYQKIRTLPLEYIFSLTE